MIDSSSAACRYGSSSSKWAITGGCNGGGFDPDLRIQAVIRQIFARVGELGSARQVFLSLRAEQVHFPRPSDGKKLVSFE